MLTYKLVTTFLLIQIQKTATGSDRDKNSRLVEIYPWYSRVAPFYRATTPKGRDEFNLKHPENTDSATRYVKIPRITEKPAKTTEEPISLEHTLEKYRNVPNGPEFITSRHAHKPIAADNNKIIQFENGLFTKINTAIRKQISKMFRPFRSPQLMSEGGDEGVGDEGYSEDDWEQKYVDDGDENRFVAVNNRFGERKRNYTRLGTVERVPDSKRKRFLSIFTILQFENSRCQAQGSFLSYEGTCYHRSECARLGGYVMGACAKGYGVCCVCKSIFLLNDSTGV